MYGDYKTAKDRIEELADKSWDRCAKVDEYDGIERSGTNDWAFLPVVFGVGVALAALIIMWWGPEQFIEDVAQIIYDIRN